MELVAQGSQCLFESDSTQFAEPSTVIMRQQEASWEYDVNMGKVISYI